MVSTPYEATPYEVGGRVEQKRRTRAALVEAARELLARGTTPTVEDAAAAARVSRTTAYRYFPSQWALLVAAYPTIDAQSLLPPDAPEDVAERLARVVDAFVATVLEGEPQHRATLRVALQVDAEARAQLPLRQGRAIGWFEDALSPLRGRLPDAVLRRLVLAIRSATGIEALVWLTDVAGLSREEARDLMCWSARSLLAGALAEHEVADGTGNGAGS